MATQIEQYRVAFDKMSLSQKKAFIEKLQKQLHGKRLPEYTKFLKECEQKYNSAAFAPTNVKRSTAATILLGDGSIDIWKMIRKMLIFAVIYIVAMLLLCQVIVVLSNVINRPYRPREYETDYHEAEDIRRGRHLNDLTDKEKQDWWDALPVEN